MQVEEAKKKSGLLAERKTVKLALTKAEDELKSLQQKSFDEEQARSLEITKINAENKQEITELEKKNESVKSIFLLVVFHFSKAQNGGSTDRSKIDRKKFNCQSSYSDFTHATCHTLLFSKSFDSRLG